VLDVQPTEDPCAPDGDARGSGRRPSGRAGRRAEPAPGGCAAPPKRRGRRPRSRPGAAARSSWAPLRRALDQHALDRG
jgi:hypothetical protein